MCYNLFKIIIMAKKKTETKEEWKEFFTEKQVTTMLQNQIKACANAIDGDNLSQYTAKKKIYEVKLVEIK